MARIDIPDGEGDELMRLWGVNPDMGRVAATFSAKVYGATTVPVRERELVRMRIAQLNECPV
jgi:alkylhydroperoxidase family enzyme